ncbi:MAG: polysaccharide biosynthesis tyrosine autokinase, partial [Clostridia bacterium]|nr:polysaccharide biosynthesis tyrosine autokinase [Clostridia bacterium]
MSADNSERRNRDGMEPVSERAEMRSAVSETANIEPKSLADFGQDILDAAKRLYFLPVILSVVFCAIFCLRARSVFNPVYQASATFTVNVTNMSSKNSATYSINLAKQLSNTFPYIFKSDVLNNLIMQDLGLDEIPATITAQAVGDTNLFTMNVFSRTPQTSYNVLKSAISNYPKVADFVVGNTELTLISETGLPEKPINDISYKTELAKGVAVGCAAALLIIVLSTLTRTTVKSADELKTMLNLRNIGSLPYIGRRRRGETSRIEITDPDASKSFCDAIRLVRSRTERLCRENGYRVILVASSMPGEGKTTAATNLAMSFALSGKKTALLDCDIRKPSAMGELANKDAADISDYLRGSAGLDDIISEPSENLLVLNSKTPSDEAAELLGTERMRGLIDELLERVDYIILDSPPASVIADAVVLSNLADCVLYVIRQEYTKKSRILDGLNHLSNGRAVFLGYILNSADGGSGGYGYGAYGRYSRYGRYARYG